MHLEVTVQCKIYFHYHIIAVGSNCSWQDIIMISCNIFGCCWNCSSSCSLTCFNFSKYIVSAKTSHRIMLLSLPKSLIVSCCFLCQNLSSYNPAFSTKISHHIIILSLPISLITSSSSLYQNLSSYNTTSLPKISHHIMLLSLPKSLITSS